jgi:methylthioribose-1-phosphate isomerase
MKAIIFKNNRLFYLDQRYLPSKEIWRECKTLKEGYSAIKHLKIRGAPLIGVFSAYCICIALNKFSPHKNIFLRQLKEAIEYLKKSRPTAVNLSWALERLEKVVLQYKDREVSIIKKEIVKEAKKIHKEDIDLCKKMAEFGAGLIKPGDRILTHCNTGFLATSGQGTALAVIYKAHQIYNNIKIYVDETRPLLQGARLTCWELKKKKINFSLICDNMAAYLMQKKKIDKIFVGADRIAANGDVANKIGTYNLAVLAHRHKVPFFVVAPSNSFDLKLKKGETIPIEERNEDEVRKVLNKVYIAPKGIKVWNPAFDITPHRYIKAIITEKGIIKPPFRENIRKILEKRR